MTVTVDTYRLLFYSEKLLPKVNGLWTGCRIATTANGFAMASLGETTLTKTGRLKGKAGRRADLLRGMKGTGDPQRPSFNQSHTTGIAQGMFRVMPQPIRMNTRDWGLVVSKLEHHAISIAVRLGALPTSAKLDDYTRADHQILLYDFLGGDTRAVDPMHDHSSVYRGDKVPLAEVRKAAAAIEGGMFITELFPRGDWTAAARLRAEKNGELRLIGQRLDQVTDRRNELADELREVREDNTDLGATLREQGARIIDLEQQIADSQSGTGNAKAAGWESALVHATGAITQLRTMGPGGTT